MAAWKIFQLGSFLLVMSTMGNIPLGKMHDWEKYHWDNSTGKYPIGKSHIGKGPDPAVSLGSFPMGIVPSGLFPTDSSREEFSQLGHFPSGVFPMVIFTNRNLPNQVFSQWTFSQYQIMEVNHWAIFEGNGTRANVALYELQLISFEIIWFESDLEIYMQWYEPFKQNF